MQNDDSTFDLVEREIQRAEELLARDLTLINDVDSNWTPSKGRKMPQNPRLPETRRKELIANLRAGRNDDSDGNSQGSTGPCDRVACVPAAAADQPRRAPSNGPLGSEPHPSELERGRGLRGLHL